ncbi:hypothetical protein A5668_08615 [Mycolicibacterium fortuitum]|uniref:hypothetical protein n=1 Tax=Mycolicibacterium fortuitum TaxID=1766 RepID=UPI0007EAF54B|nr:hypothetical protein [Mycolicibacterium fortuitum]OBA94965.1 hypothetical protein A5668_08615 [Mycolicibacterium fortuitum]UBV22131.1 hypothetical protein H8Z59_02575 [Mycolicibacterium fortuitum]
MTSTAISREHIGELMDAVHASGRLESLRLEQYQLVDYLAALHTFMGGPLGSVDAFLSDIQEPSATEHRVWWLRGNTIGSLVVQAHQGTEGQPEQAQVTGYVRHLSAVKRVDIDKADFQYDQFGDGIPEVKPSVRILLGDEEIVVSVAGRLSERDRAQAAGFISQLLNQLAALGSS